MGAVHPPSDAAVSMAAMLHARAGSTPDRTAFVFATDGDEQEEALSYAALDARARTVAAVLHETLAPGDRALLLHPPGLEFIAAFYGCLYAGVVAVPAYPPDPGRLDRTLPRLRAIAEDARVSAVLTHSFIEALLGEGVEAARAALPGRWIPTDRLPQRPDAPGPVAAGEGDLAFLQYTSGSTGLPKGVALAHGHLLHHFSQIVGTFGFHQDSRVAGWVPPYHDMGLIGGILLPVFAGIPSFLLSPIHFLQRPARWLQLMSRHRATLSGAPNFGYELAVRKTTPEERARLDLSAWESASCGAEPVNAETLERFAAAFAGCGFRREALNPCYGLAESTLVVTTKPHATAPRTRQVDRERLAEGAAVPPTPGAAPGRTLVSCGVPDPTTRLRIVDPASCTELPDGRVGEIWVASASVGGGYWQRPEENRRIFGALLADTGEGPFLRTGDLGFLHDGELYVTGRLKDLVVIRGRNIHPEDVEEAVGRCHPALRPGNGAAFATDVEGVEHLVVVHEVDPRWDGDLDAVVGAVRRCVSESHAVGVHAVVLVEPRTIPKTSSGKIQRHACRAAFEEGSLATLLESQDARAPSPSEPGAGAEETGAPVDAVDAAAIEDWLVERVAEEMGIEPAAIDRRAPLADLGLDSLVAVSVAADLEAWLGRPVNPSLAWDFPTVSELAAHLATGATAERQPGESGARARLAGEPIAVVGYGLRFPGAEDPEGFWDLMRSGRDGIREVPPDRWDADRYFDPHPGTPGRTSTRFGGFLDGIDRFDPLFFGISRREAEWMDPQQRLLLEVTWEAFEHAGIPPGSLAGSRTGVFAGIGGVDYSHLVQERVGTNVSAWVGTGNAHSIAANRISYLLDLRGPSLAVDTACSSSLVAIHLACQSLWTGESDCALAGGVNAILTPHVSIAFSGARMLAPDGRCKTFDADADGYVRSEGAGVVVLKRLSDARRDGDRILGVIRGTAVNQDGRTPGITAPRREAQKGVIREALRQAGVEPEAIGYVEAHGTGTALGDPIEIGALADVLHRAPVAGPVRVGSVKANVGHLETASGIAGLVKLLLCFEHEEIPGQPHLRVLNPHLGLDGTGLEIPLELQAWPRGARPRIGSVSSFGFGGTNAHVVVEEPPPPAPARPSARPRHLLALSARTEGSLRALAERYARHLDAHPELDVSDVCFTANAGRAHLARRLALSGASLVELSECLARFAAGERAPHLVAGGEPGRERPRLAMLFTGQGAQHSGMAQRLYWTETTFRRTLERCAEILSPHLERPLLEVLFDPGAASRLDETAYTQPALVAVEVALAELWRSWGVVPDAVLGHSVGEYAAACVAGVLSLEDTLRLVAERARLMQGVRTPGAMAALAADEERVRRALGPFAGEVSIAACNGARSVVISGARDAVAAVVSTLESEGVRARPLRVSHAFHSPLLDPVLDRLEAVARGFSFHAPRVPVARNLDGACSLEAPDARYWRRHAREPVRFADGMASLAEAGCSLFLEVGPHPTLLGLGRGCLPAGAGSWIPSLRRGSDDWEILLDGLGALYTAGLDVDWRGFDRAAPRRRVSLPSYAFDREPYWIGADAAKGAALEPPAGGHPLLGRRLRSALEARQFELRLSAVDGGPHAYLADHRVQGSIVVPAALYLAMAAAASAELFGSSAVELEDASFRKALFLPAQGARTVQLVVSPPAAGAVGFQILALSGGEAEETWSEHASGRIRLHAGSAPDPGASLDAIRARCTETLSAGGLYDALEAGGLAYGACFRGVQEIWRRDGEALGRVALPDAVAAEDVPGAPHPALLDACFHVVAAALPRQEAERGDAYLPVGLRGLRLTGAVPGRIFSHCVVAVTDGGAEADVRVLDESGAPVAEVRGLELLRLRGAAAARDPAGWRYAVRWEELAPTTASALERGAWLLLADEGGVAERVAKGLADAGHTPVLAFAGEAFERIGERSLRVRPTEAEDHERLLVAGLPPGFERFSGIVHAWALDAPGPEPDTPAPDATTQRALEGAALLVRALARSEAAPPRLFLLSAGAQATADDVASSPGPAMLWGLGRVAALEHPRLGTTRIDLARDSGELEWDALVRELLAPGEEELALRGARRLAPRLVRLADGEAQPEPSLRLPGSESFRLESTAPGRLDGLVYRPVTRTPPPPGALEIEVEAAGLNFRDVLNAMGLYPGGPIPFGGECAGRVSAVGEGVEAFRVGDEVLGVAQATFSAFALTTPELVVRKPASLAFDEAATIPITFLTACYALHHLAGLQAGERVLVHAGAGGVGLAAIALAHRVGAEVFATAGSPEKREFLASLGVAHCLDSRSLEFADAVLERTDGRGVDVVLNSLPGEFITRSLAVLAPYGRFVEIGRTDIYQNRQIGLLPFQNNLSYFAVDLEKLCRERPALVRDMLAEVMDAFAAGALEPLPRRVFAADEAVAAFRHMAQRRNIGKVVLSMRRPAPAAASGRFAGSSILVTGGCGGLGLALARWLVDQGARHLVLLSRHGAPPEAEPALEALRRAGASVRVRHGDVADRARLAQVLDEIRAEGPPLRGVVHAAGVLDDGLLARIELDRLRSVLAPKVTGAWNLHALTRADDLDFFVLLSSVAGLLGSPGQASYAAANAFLDALAHHRRAQGLRAVALDFGPWAEVGMAARGAGARASARGLPPMPPELAVEALADALSDERAQLVVADVDWARLLAQLGDRRPGLVADLVEGLGAGGREDTGAGASALLALEGEARERAAVELVQSELAAIMGLDLAELDPEAPLTQLGMDSLMALELKERLETHLGITLGIEHLVEDPTIRDVGAVALEELDARRNVSA